MTDSINGAALPRLDDFIPNDTLELDIPHPRTGKPSGWRITLAGPAHPATIAAQQEAARARLQQERQRGARAADEDVTGERTFRQLSRRIIGWSPVDLGEGRFDYSPAAAERLMAEPRFSWVRGHVIAALVDDEAFFGTSARS